MNPVDVPAVGVVVRDDDGRLLLVLRGNEPDRNTWSLPGGRVEPGEASEAAAVREALEETGLHVEIRSLIGQVRRAHASGGSYLIDDYAVDAVGGNLSAGDDALDARWFTVDELADVPVTPGLIESLTDWGVLPSSG